ncbi:MAG: TatD family hydrolase [Ignavibacteria bacterium]|nr:TatD family hydrolase [Ignavibacteria bacterium]
MIDTHCHLDSSEFESDRNEVIQRAKDSGVEFIIVPSTDFGNLDKVVQIAAENENIYCALGIHPHNAIEYSEAVEEKIISYLKEKKNKVVAIGEIGLDYYYNFAPPEIQKEVFVKQLKLAKQYNLPAIIHNRESNLDLLEILRSEQDGNLSFVLHCFSQDEFFLNEALEIGGYISFTGNVTYKRNSFTNVIERVPNDRFFLETDAPYMSPQPFRGKRNEPSYLKHIAEKISEVKSLSLNQVTEMTTKNAIKFFKILVLLLLFFAPQITLAEFFQDKKFEDEPEEEYFVPYPKFLGIGGSFGFNTIVILQSWSEGGIEKNRNAAQEGKFFYSGHICFSPIDFNINRFEFTYTYFKKELDTNYKDLADIYRTFSLSSLFLINPSMRVNFFGGLGLTYITKTTDLGHPYRASRKSFGANFSVGFIFNLPISTVGLFTFTGEWQLIFDFTHDRNVWEFNLKRYVDAYYYYSLPRLNITWYPEFFN